MRSQFHSYHQSMTAADQRRQRNCSVLHRTCNIWPKNGFNTEDVSYQLFTSRGVFSCDTGDQSIIYLKITSYRRQKFAKLMNQFQIELVIHHLLSSLCYAGQQPAAPCNVSVYQFTCLLSIILIIPGLAMAFGFDSVLQPSQQQTDIPDQVGFQG